MPWAANRLRGLGKIAWSWWSWLFLFCLRGLLFLLLQYSQQVQQNSLQPQLLTLFKPASGQSMPSEPKAFGSPSFWRVTKYLCGIWVADKITYYPQWTWPKRVVPYRLWRFDKVCTSMLCAKTGYREVGGPLSVVNVFAQIWTSHVHSKLLYMNNTKNIKNPNPFASSQHTEHKTAQVP